MKLWNVFASLMSSTAVDTTSLNITALTKSEGRSTLQCWQLKPPISTQSSSGLTGASVLPLSDAPESLTWVKQPPRSVGGLRNAAFPTFTWVVSGLLHITLEESDDEAWIVGGRYGLLFANDDDTSGHTSDFSGPDETILMLTTLPADTVPKHKVLYSGQCEYGELVGI